jgi:hypothetical protein
VYRMASRREITYWVRPLCNDSVAISTSVEVIVNLRAEGICPESTIDAPRNRVLT